jgi:hypothetical protein
MSADPGEEPPDRDVPTLGTPQLKLSTRIGLGVLAAVLVFCLASFWLPSPAGLIAGVLFVYVGLSLALLVVSDLGKLREDRQVAQRASIAQPTVDDPDWRLMLDATGLTNDRLKPWRASRRWFGPTAIVALATAVLAPWLGLKIIAVAVLVVASLRDLQVSVRLWDSMTRGAWGELSRFEQASLRVEAGFVGLVLLSIWLGVIVIVAYLFSGHVPVRWNTYAFTLVYGGMGLMALWSGRHWIASAFRAQPGFKDDAVEVMRIRRGSSEDIGE